MKSINLNTLAGLSVLTAGSLLFAVSIALGAAEIPTGKGGAKLLMKPSVPVSETSVSRAMSCSNCKDEFIAQKDVSARGANKPVVHVAKHLCTGCSTTIAVAGYGKAKNDVVTHTCSACGTENLACCTGKSTQTKFEIAPLK